MTGDVLRLKFWAIVFEMLPKSMGVEKATSLISGIVKDFDSALDSFELMSMDLRYSLKLIGMEASL